MLKFFGLNGGRYDWRCGRQVFLRRRKNGNENALTANLVLPINYSCCLVVTRNLREDPSSFCFLAHHWTTSQADTSAICYLAYVIGYNLPNAYRTNSTQIWKYGADFATLHSKVYLSSQVSTLKKFSDVYYHTLYKYVWEDTTFFNS